MTTSPLQHLLRIGPAASRAPTTVADPGERTSPRLAFITGCGRSGTTILGTILSHHRNVRYLNDCFELWLDAFPRADIWGRLAQPAPDARVAMDERDVEPGAAARFLAELRRRGAGKPLLVEKLAINNFRLPFLHAIAPHARLINIVRHGVEVARSIERQAVAGLWYGRHERKWHLLVEHARAHGYEGALEHVASMYDRGLLEWRMSVEAAEQFFARHPHAPPRLLLRYEELLADPAGAARRLCAFLGLDEDPAMTRFAGEQVRRRHPAGDAGPAPPSTEPIAGDTLRRLGYAFST